MQKAKTVFRNFHFYAFYRHFSIFSLYNTSKCLGLNYLSFFTAKWVIFVIFWQYFNITLVILEISMSCDLSFRGIFFSKNYDGNKYISFQGLHDPRGVIFQNIRLFFIGPMNLCRDRPAAARRCACLLNNLFRF